MYEWIGEAITSGAEVVTASRRLARELRREFDAAQLADGKNAWLTPAILGWDDWLRRLADSADAPKRGTLRLGPHAESILWERSLGRHAKDRPPGTRSVVRQSVRAWRMLQAWRIPTRTLSDSARTHDERLFARLAIDYEQRLSDNGWVDDAGMPALVRSLVRDGTIPVPPRVVFAGYDRLSPNVEALFDTLSGLGSVVEGAPERQ